MFPRYVSSQAPSRYILTGSLMQPLATPRRLHAGHAIQLHTISWDFLSVCCHAHHGCCSCSWGSKACSSRLPQPSDLKMSTPRTCIAHCDHSRVLPMLSTCACTCVGARPLSQRQHTFKARGFAHTHSMAEHSSRPAKQLRASAGPEAREVSSPGVAQAPGISVDAYYDDQPNLLYIDGLNYASEKFFINQENWALDEAAANVARFVRAAAHSQWRVVAFIDAALPSAETQGKWKQRRERDVLYSERHVPHALKELLSEMFRYAWSGDQKEVGGCAWRGAGLNQQGSGQSLPFSGPVAPASQRLHVLGRAAVTHPKQRPRACQIVCGQLQCMRPTLALKRARIKCNCVFNALYR